MSGGITFLVGDLVPRRVSTGETMSLNYNSFVLTNSAASNQTFTCPTLVGSIGRMFSLKNQSQTYDMVIDGSGSEQFIPIGGVPINDFTLAPGEACFIQSDGAYWNIL